MTSRFELSKGFDEAPKREDKEDVVHFLFERLPCVPIKVIRANTMDSEACVIRYLDPFSSQLVAAVVYKDHKDREFREVKYFCSAFAGGGLGSLLMSETKRDAVSKGLFFIVLYASNTATVFFEKQRFVTPDNLKGLSRTVMLPRVEQYQRSTLMAVDLIDEFNLLRDKPTHLKIGDKVKVECGLRRTSLEDASVIEVSQCRRKIMVHFAKWASQFDEWIVACSCRVIAPTTKRIRITFTSDRGIPLTE